MRVGCCENCKYQDLIVDDDTTIRCPRCSGTIHSLGIDSAEWNLMSVYAQRAIIRKKFPTVEELFREAAGAGEEPESESSTETEVCADATAATEAEPESAHESDVVTEPESADETIPEAEPESEEAYEQVYSCYKCNSIASHDGANDRYYCPECGSDMIPVGLTTKEWADLCKEEKRNAIEEAKIRHMVSQIKKVSYDDSESVTTQSIINVVDNKYA